jgi:hypothetical protein
MEFTTHFELQSQTTRLVDRHLMTQAYGSLTLSAALFQGTWLGSWRTCLQTTIRRRGADSHGELFPLQSPLLWKSRLFSFPPLNYMLKFSGSSCFAEIRNEVTPLTTQHTVCVCECEYGSEYLTIAFLGL